MSEFKDWETATRFRDVVKRQVESEVDRLRPDYVYATVQEIDLTKRQCTVIFPGDTSSVPVRLGSIVPKTPGQVVRVEGRLGDRYVADVMGDAFILFSGFASTDETEPNPPTNISLFGSLGMLTAVWVESDTETVKNGLGEYQIQLATDESFSSMVRDVRISGTYFVAINLKKQQDYFLRIRSVSATGKIGSWSATASIQTPTDAESTENDPEKPSGNGILMAEFDLPGPVWGGGSTRHIFPVDASLDYGVVTLDEAGVTDTIVSFAKNGGMPFAVVTLGTGSDQEWTSFDIQDFAAETDYITMLVTTAGAQAMALHATLWNTADASG